MPKIVIPTAQAVLRYAERFHAAVGGDHHVASPLGAWLILALVAGAAPESRRAACEEVLGIGIEEAVTAARALLGDPHPAVAAAAALWSRPTVRTAGFDRWAGALPAAVEQGAMPDQDGADQWASRRTFGLIEEFPIQIKTDTLLILATALATRIRWDDPFDTVPGDQLGGVFGPRVHTALRAASEHATAIVTGTAAGDVAVHSAGSANGLDVVSVIADPGVARHRVLAAAHDVAALLVGGGLAGRVPDPFDLPLGEGPAWTITESRHVRPAWVDRTTSWSATLPAWDAATDLDLLKDRAFGFHTAVDVLVDALGPGAGVDPDSAAAAQSTAARYGRFGFEAAAVTALALARSGAPGQPREVVHRQIDLRFGHPYAVVAVARQYRGEPGPWHGLPVFSAWVTEPGEPETEAPEA